MTEILKKLIEQAETIITAASGSLLGVLSLIILVFAILSFLFFRQSSQQIRIGIVVSLFVGVSLLIIATTSPDSPHVSNNHDNPPVKDIQKGVESNTSPIPENKDDTPTPKIDKLPSNINTFDLTGNWHFQIQASKSISRNQIIRNRNSVAT